MELWQGFSTPIRKHEHDILLMCNVVYNMRSSYTLYEFIRRETLKHDPSNVQRNLKQNLEGLVVWETHTNEMYRIVDIDFEKSPRITTAYYRRGSDSEITLMQHYNEVSVRFSPMYALVYIILVRTLKTSTIPLEIQHRDRR